MLLLLDLPKEVLMNRNAVFVIAIAISIATFAATIVVSYGALKVEAAKSDKWCYTKFNSELVCFQGKSSCIDAFDLSGGAALDCQSLIVNPHKVSFDSFLFNFAVLTPEKT